MEEDPHYLPVKSIFLKQSVVQQQLENLRDTVEEAKDLIHYEQAHNPEILFALDVIERFLRKKSESAMVAQPLTQFFPRSFGFMILNETYPTTTSSHLIQSLMFKS